MGPYTIDIDRKADRYYHSEFDGDGILRKISLISWFLVLLSAFWWAVHLPDQRHLDEESLR